MLPYISKWVRKTFVILGMLLGLSPIAFAQTSLENGTYTLTNNVAHDNPVGQGMARSYTEEQSDLVVSKEGLWFTLGFNNTQYMGEFTIKVNGSQTSYEVVYNSNNVKKLKFKIPNLDASISVGMYVVPMNTEVEYTVTLNQGSLKLIEKEAVEEVEEVKSEESMAKAESSGSNSFQTGSNTQNNNQTVVRPSVSTQTDSKSSSQPQVEGQTKSEQVIRPQASTVPSENSTQTQTKVEEETNKVEKSAETSESSEQEEVASETEEIVKEESKVQEKSEVQESDVEETASETAENQEIAEEASIEGTVIQEKGNWTGITIMIIAAIALAGGLYYWHFKIRK